MFIFLDESGDLGFDFTKQKTTKYFVITVLALDNISVQDEFRKAVRRTLKNKLNRKKNKKRIVHELKGTNTALSIKEYFYRQLPPDGWHIYSLTLNKARTKPHLQTKTGRKKLYNFLSRVLLEKVVFPQNARVVNLAIDRSKSKEEIWDFNRYLINHLEALLPLETQLNITHENSNDNPCLQAVDLFCWGIARKNISDVAWYSFFGHRIQYQTTYLADK